MAHRHPPLDFPLFGLDETWRGPRWLDFLEGRSGDPVVGAWLGHGQDERRHPTGTWAFVGTFSRPRVEAGWLGSDETFEQHLASRAAMLVVDDRPLLDQLLATPGEWESWDTASLSVRGRTLAARRLDHAGARAILSFDLPGLGLIVHSRGFEGAGLSLEEASDLRRYHVDPAGPLDYPGVLVRSIEVALGRLR